jgi:hypothetical protein
MVTLIVDVHDTKRNHFSFRVYPHPTHGPDGYMGMLQMSNDFQCTWENIAEWASPNGDAADVKPSPIEFHETCVVRAVQSTGQTSDAALIIVGEG